MLTPSTNFLDIWHGHYGSQQHYRDNFEQGVTPFVDRDTFCHFDLNLMFPEDANVDAEENAVMNENDSEMQLDPNTPSSAVNTYAQQLASTEKEETSLEQPKKRGRPAKSKDKEVSLSQADLERISASVDQEMESMFQSVTTGTGNTGR